MNRMPLFCFALSIALLLEDFAPANGQTWTGITNSDWNTTTNWSPAGVPNSPTANVTFPTTSSLTTVNISSSVQARSMTLASLPEQSYAIESSFDQVLSGLTAITLQGAGGADISLSGVSTGSLIFAAGSNLTLTNNSTAPGGYLAIDSTTVVGTPGNGGVIFAGPGLIAFAGSFAYSGGAESHVVVGGLTKAGPGQLNMAGDGSNLSGGITLNGGTLNLDYSSNSASKLGAGALTLGGGTLTLGPNQSTAITQLVPLGTFVNVGHTDLVALPGGTLTLSAGAITRNIGGTVEFCPLNADSAPVTISTSTTNTNGLLGAGPAWATFGTDASSAYYWATASNGQIAGLLAYSANTYTLGANTDVTTSASIGGVSPNSLRFNTGSPTLTLSGMNTLQSGGILVTPNATGGTITGGMLNAGAGYAEIIVHQYSSGSFTINSSIVSYVGLTKTGPGMLVLGGNNTSLIGPINVNRGGLTVTTTAAVNSASTINFNDDRFSMATGSGLQQFTVQLGSGVSGAISPPISLSAFSATDYGTDFSTGTSTNSIVALNGVLNSAPGLTTPIRFAGSSTNTSGFYLTNVNFFTGNISLFAGSLGITTDTSLGNEGNTLVLEVNDTTNGGLVFLNGGVTIVRPVVVNTPTRIVCNGTDSNTIATAISGTGGIYKDGTGTLTLLGANTVTGGVTVAAGTLAIGVTDGLPAGTNVLVKNAATFVAGTSSTRASSIGAVTIDGGTLRLTNPTGHFYISQLAITAAGGTLDCTGTTFFELGLLGAAGINILGNSTWISPANSSFIGNLYGPSDLPIAIAPGVTLNSGIALSSLYPPFGFRVTGGGTLYQNSDATNVQSLDAALTIVQSTFRVTDASSNGGTGNLGAGPFTLDGGTFSYGGSTATTFKPIALTSDGGTIQVESVATTLTANGAITGPGPLTKIGPGTLVLGNSNNTFTGITISAGVVQAPFDAVLGTGPVTINTFGTLTFTGNTATARMFTINGGTLSVAAGQTVTLSNNSIAGGFLAGPGTFATLGGGSTAFGNGTTASSAVLNLFGADNLINFSQGGQLTVSGGPGAPATFTRVTNQGSGTITVAPTSQLFVSDFQSYGLLMLNNSIGTTSTLLTNVGTTPLYFNGGSRTFIGTPATAGTFVAGIDLHGQNAVVAGGLFVNNGYVVDSTSSGAVVMADYGALVKGAGFYQYSPVTQNGGRVQAGNSPGSASFGQLTFGPGGVSSYVFAIDDATGAAGPSPNASGQVSGWGLMKSVQRQIGTMTTSGDFAWTADATDKLTFAIETLVNPTTVGTDVTGLMADFDPSRPYSWPAVTWSGAYSGPTNVASLDASTTFDTSDFENSIAGTFGWSFDSSGQTLSLTYTPSAVPEPGTLALVGFTAAVWLVRRHRYVFASSV